MDDRVHACERAGDRPRIANVSLENLDVDAGQVLPATAGEVVEPADLETPREELGDQIGPDEAASAGDESSTWNV